MDLKSYVLLVLSVAVVLLAVAVLLRAPNRAASKAFLAHAISVAFWTDGIVVFLNTNVYSMAQISIRIYYFAALGIGASIMLFSLLFGAQKLNIFQKVMFVVTLFYATIILLWKDFILGTVVVSPDQNLLIINDLTYGIYASIVVTDFLIALFVFYSLIRKKNGKEKQQAKFLFFGYLFSSVIGTVFNLFLPWLGNYSLIWVGPLSIIVFVLAVGYTIVRHKLFDIRAAVIRSLLYVVSFLFFSFLYVASVLVLSNTITKDFPEGLKQSLNIVVALLIAYSVIPFKKEYDRITNKVFFKDAYIPQDAINNINSLLVGTQPLEIVLKNITELLNETMYLRYSKFVILTKDSDYSTELEFQGQHVEKKIVSGLLIKISKLHVKTMSIEHNNDVDGLLISDMTRNGIDIIAKMVVGDQNVGFLLVGPKRNGSAHSEKDIRFIEAVADGVAIAAQNALRFEEISEFNETLQKKIDDATRQLQRTNEKLKALDEAKDDFISMASHQLRTPLTSVKGYLSMVLDGDAGEVNKAQRRMLSQSFNSADRMAFLIGDLLNLSRLKSGKFVIENSPTYLPDMIVQELSQLKATAEAHGLILSYEAPKDFPTLMLDDTKIRQVIMNFLDNAIYYTPSGGEIIIKLEVKSESVEFTVKDSGIGVASEDQCNLFTKFYRAENARHARPDGTGLGLFMARKVIVAQGGAIIFKSKLGKGSTFGFSVPKKFVVNEKT